MKKTVALLLSMLMLFFAAVPAFALAEDTATLQAKFHDGTTLEGADYVYYSPISGLVDTTHYPLIVFLHGEDVGATRRSQISENGFCNYASTEFQVKFKNAGGCFLFAPRRYGNGTWQYGDTVAVKSYIDQFVSMYQTNIDTKRIYIMGYSAGGNMVWNMLEAYPDFFAAAIPAASLSQPAVTVTEKLKRTAVWLFSCDNDHIYGASSINARTTFNNMKNATYNLASVRMTTFSTVVLPNGSFIPGNGTYSFPETHNVWYAVMNNMHMEDGSPYSYQVTVDGEGTYFDFYDKTGVIDWLSAQTREGVKNYSEDVPDEVRVPFRLLEFILSIFTRLFNRLFGGGISFGN